MKTNIFNMKKTIDQHELAEITNLLQRGKTVAFPTETVYGLGADATNKEAVEKIFSAKGRPSDNPLIVHVATKSQLLSLVKDVPDYVERLIDKFSPGPITYVLHHAGKVAPVVTAGLDTIGVRIPNHPVALSILKASALPLAAPSANRSGRPSPTEADHVADDLTGRIAAIVDGGMTDVGIESTVVDCTGEIPLILRPGTITAENIKNAIGACHVYQTEDLPEKPKSPGMKYVHYAPEVPLFLVEKSKIAELIHDYQAQGNRVALLYASHSLQRIPAEQRLYIGTDEHELAKRLYRILRSFNKRDMDMIVCEYPSLSENHAIIDRLKRAATEIIM